jgi:hypothetical protein
VAFTSCPELGRVVPRDRELILGVPSVEPEGVLIWKDRLDFVFISYYILEIN